MKSPLQPSWVILAIGLSMGMGALAAPQTATLCTSGKRQSPIDIRGAQRAALPKLQFDYPSVPLKLDNDGHTVRVRLSRSGTLQIGTTRYTLDQFHFHTPGGDRIDGEVFPMVAHILHRSPSGQLLGVAILFRLGEPSALLDRLLPLIPAQPGAARIAGDQRVSAGELLPEAHGYYRYTGSLTATPCTEGVEWIVLKQAMTLSAGQLAQYKLHFGDNMRDPQPLHQRIVQEIP